MRTEGVNLHTHYKQLLRLYTSEETGMETSLSIRLALIGCIDLKFYDDVANLLKREQINLVPLSIQDFIDKHNFTVKWNDLTDYVDMNPRHCMYVTALLLNLIGKTLNSTNYAPWMDRRTDSYGTAVGFDRDTTDLVKYQPSQEFPCKYNAEIRARWQIRRRCFIEAWVLSTKPGPIGRYCSLHGAGFIERDRVDKLRQHSPAASDSSPGINGMECSSQILPVNYQSI